MMLGNFSVREAKPKMETSFIPVHWAWENIPKELLPKSLSNIRYEMFIASLIEETKRFIEASFPRSNITVEHEMTVKAKSHGSATCIGSDGGVLISDGSESRFSFGVLISDKQWATFQIRHIPALENSKHITLFFRVLRDEIGRFSRNILSSQGTESLERIAFGRRRECYSFFLSLRRVVTLKYLFYALDLASHENDILGSREPRIPLKIVRNAFDFCTELSTQNIEGRQVKTGFAFHESHSILKKNAVSLLRLDRRFEFGDFDKTKAIIEMADGEKTWLNVSNDEITHIFTSKYSFSDWWRVPHHDKKRFYGNPVFLNINAGREVCFFHVTQDGPKLLLRSRNGKTILQDESYVKERLSQEFLAHRLSQEHSRALSAWLVDLSIRSHGTTVFIIEPSPGLEQNFLKSIPVSKVFPVLGRKNYTMNILEMLDRLSQTDGALFIDRNLVPKFAGVILPMTRNENPNDGGARHNSAKSFSKNHNCLGLVVSHDGPITVFKNGDTVCTL